VEMLMTGGVSAQMNMLMGTRIAGMLVVAVMRMRMRMGWMRDV